MRALALLLLVFASVAPVPVAAIGPGEAMKDAKLEARARDIGRQLRCLVCQNQSIDDSDAPLARDLRRLVRTRLKAGDTNEQVIAYIHARYGDFVLLRPPVDSRTWLLWYGPPAVLLVALFLILMRSRRRRLEEGHPVTGLTADEAARADDILKRKDDPQ